MLVVLGGLPGTGKSTVARAPRPATGRALAAHRRDRAGPSRRARPGRRRRRSGLCGRLCPRPIEPRDRWRRHRRLREPAGADPRRVAECRRAGRGAARRGRIDLLGRGRAPPPRRDAHKRPRGLRAAWLVGRARAPLRAVARAASRRGHGANDTRRSRGRDPRSRGARGRGAELENGNCRRGRDAASPRPRPPGRPCSPVPRSRPRR